jgi:hypothetical protein
VTGLDPGARPIYDRVPGAPFQPGDLVRVVAAIDPEATDVSDHIGKAGRVDQSFPGDPMVGVKLDDGAREEFWRDELAVDGGAS